ncbi:MAG: hypothetical protein ABFS32_07025 [Bacteroidota bacterium]
MFTENEISSLALIPEIKEATIRLKNEFIEKEAPFMEISEHDFLSLIFLTPSVGIALANDSVSLMEEMALNKKARKYSKGGYFMKQDPVVTAMGHLIKNYDEWADTFYAQIKLFVEILIDKDALKEKNKDDNTSNEQLCIDVLQAPFFLIRVITSFLSNAEDEDLAAERKVLKVEYDRIVEILEKIDLIDLPIVQNHIKRLIIK